MLVLSRETKQRIVIGENIELVVVAVTGGYVKLGIPLTLRNEED